MTKATDVLRMQWCTMRRHPWTVLVTLLSVAGVLHLAMRHGEVPKALTYLGAMLLGGFVVDLFAQWKGESGALPVRQPQREAVIVLSFTALGYLTLFLRFAILDWQEVPGLVRLVILPMFGFVFPVFVALVLLKLKYAPRDLGFSIGASCLVALPILVLTAGAALCVAPAELTVGPVLAEEGWTGLLIMGLLSAGLPEEFARMLLQTRLGAWLKNPAMGLFIATVLWAFMHAPKWIGDGGELYEGVMGSVRIIPLGLLWGYMTHRTKSILPAIFVHGFNVWGLQNF